MGIRQRTASTVALAAAVCVTLAGCTNPTAPEPAPEPEPVVTLTASEAQDTYLRAICPVNDVWYEVDLRVDRLRSALLVNPPDLDGHTLALTDALSELADTATDAANTLDDTLETMPPNTHRVLEEIRETLKRDALEAETLAEESDAQTLVDHEWAGGKERAEQVETARQLLELDGEDAPTCDGL